MYSNISVIFGGQTFAQFYVGLTTQACDAYAMKSERHFIHTLEDIIQEQGAPTKLVSDSAQTELCEHVKDVLCIFAISAWQSEPQQQQQNPTECCY